jgi:hypothetical protein
MINFSFEVPLRHLEDFHDDQDYIFCLSFLLKTKRYKDYVLGCKAGGMEIVLDNSYNELKVATPAQELIELFYDIQADYVICPDEDTWSWQQYLHIYNSMITDITQEHLYLVARNPEHFLKFEEAGVLHTAIPYEFRPRYTGQKQEGFTDLTRRFLRQSHFLGLNTADEPYRYQAYSCDTSMPVKIALENMSLQQWVKKGCPHIDTQLDFFKAKMTKEQIALAKKNIDLIKTINNPFERRIKDEEAI